VDHSFEAVFLRIPKRISGVAYWLTISRFVSLEFQHKIVFFSLSGIVFTKRVLMDLNCLLLISRMVLILIFALPFQHFNGVLFLKW
jgi:hypothetical protein